jgi:hypothetical protein
MFSCKDFSCSSLLNLDSEPRNVGRLLAKRDLQLSQNSDKYGSLREIIDQNENVFQTDFASFTKQIITSLVSLRKMKGTLLISRKLRQFLKIHSFEVEQMILRDSFTDLPFLLFLLTEFHELRIKLFQIVNNVVSCEFFGKKNGKCISIFSNGLHLQFVDSLACTDQFSMSNKCRQRTFTSKSTDVFSDTSNEEINFRANYSQKEGSIDKETNLENDSGCDEAEVIRQELFGHQLESSDDSMISFQSENLFNPKKDFKENKLTGLQIHKTCSEIPLSEPPSIYKLLSLDPCSQVIAEQSALQAQSKKFLSKVIYEEKDSKKGKIKFYSEDNDFGFITMENGEEIFVHKDDLIKANINTQKLSYFKKFYDIQVSFRYIQYQGKMKVNRKAVDVQVIGYVPLCYS